MKVDMPERDVVYKNYDFFIEKYDYNIQYFPYYKSRLRQMYDNLLCCAQNCWPDVPVHAITDLAEKKTDSDELDSQESDSQSSNIDEEILGGKEVIIIGTLFKKMQAQPNILKELSEDKKMNNLLSKESEIFSRFISENDIIFLQEGDESIELKGDIKIDQLCTGISLAAKGHINLNGSGFIVDDVCLSSLTNDKPAVDRPLIPKDYYIVFVSGLGFSKNMSQNQTLTRSLNLLFDILTGNSDFVLNKTIVNLIIAGNSVGSKARNEEKDSDNDRKVASWDNKVQSYTIDAIKLLDKFLANIGQFMYVDIMPGVLDPSTYLWPQQPMHPCLFPNAFRLDTIRGVPNPHRATYFGVDILGTSGQNVDSIRMCTNINEPTEIMRNIIEWGHIAPTCPDLLHSYPFINKDPFVIDEYPDVFFCGNQSEFNVGSFESTNGKKVDLISVPCFEDKMLAIMYNLRTRQCEMLAFN